jgi:Zn-dependent protease
VPLRPPAYDWPVSTVPAAHPGEGGLRFRLGGFAVHIPWNALIGVAIIAVLWFPEFTSARTPLAQAAMAVVFGVLLMVSVLVHELAHALTARAFRYRVVGITLWAMGGFTSLRTPRSHGPGKEAAIAVAGPLATLAVAAVSAAVAAVVPRGVAQDLLVALASANMLVGLFNLLPGSPLDGGALVKAGVWAATGSPRRGQLVAAWVGRTLAVAAGASPFVLALWLGAPPSLPLVAVGLMLGFILWSGASAQLRGAQTDAVLQSTRADRLSRPVIPVADSVSIAAVLPLLDDVSRLVVVDHSGVPMGVVTPAAARSVPAEAGATTSVLAACASVPTAVMLPADANAAQVVEAAQSSGERFIFLTAADGEATVAGVIDTAEHFASGPQ